MVRDAPQSVSEVHERYKEAGADILTAATYQLPGEEEELLKRAVDLCFGHGECLTAASVGPYGALQCDGSEYTGRYGSHMMNVASLADFHRRRLRFLVALQPKLLLFETTPLLDEARAYIQLLREMSSSDVSLPPAVISFQCPDPTHIASGELVADAVALVQAAHPIVLGIGVNCCPPRVALEIARSHPLLFAYPNSGESYDAASRDWSATEDDALDVVECGRLLWELGVPVVGGCCRVGPPQIAALHRLRTQML